MSVDLQVALVRLRLSGVPHRVVQAHEFEDWPFPWSICVLVCRTLTPSYVGDDGHERAFEITHRSPYGMLAMESRALNLSGIRIDAVEDVRRMWANLPPRSS